MTRRYTETERQHFAAYTDERARYRPVECHGGLDCWVDFGPPAMSPTRGNVRVLCCLGCAGAPLIPPELRTRSGVRYHR